MYINGTHSNNATQTDRVTEDCARIYSTTLQSSTE